MLNLSHDFTSASAMVNTEWSFGAEALIDWFHDFEVDVAALVILDCGRTEHSKLTFYVNFNVSSGISPLQHMRVMLTLRQERLLPTA
jgi:hypothetical protein